MVIFSAGMATFFILWLVFHKIQSSEDVWRERAFIVNEGTRLEGEHEAARFVALTIASAAVCTS